MRQPAVSCNAGRVNLLFVGCNCDSWHRTMETSHDKRDGDGELGWRVLVRGEEVRGFKPKQF